MKEYLGLPRFRKFLPFQEERRPQHAVFQGSAKGEDWLFQLRPLVQTAQPGHLLALKLLWRGHGRGTGEPIRVLGSQTL
jgi:hypothetical protein